MDSRYPSFVKRFVDLTQEDALAIDEALDVLIDEGVVESYNCGNWKVSHKAEIQEIHVRLPDDLWVVIENSRSGSQFTDYYYGDPIFFTGEVKEEVIRVVRPLIQIPTPKEPA